MEIFKKYFNEIKQSLQRLVEMDFIALPPEPKEVVIAPTVIKPKQTDNEDEELPAGYYDEESLAIQAEKAAKAKNRLKALMEEADAPPKPAKKEEAPAKKKKAAAAKPTKAEAKPKAEKAEKPKKAEAKVAKETRPVKAKAEPKKATKASAAKPAEKKAAAKPAKATS